MDEQGIQEWRQRRLQALADKFDGKAELGRKLGYRDGAYVGQMIAGLRPITEKLILKAEALPGCRDWFLPTTEQPAVRTAASFARRDPISVEDAVEKLAEVLAGLDEDGRDMASTTLSNLARNPSRPGKAVEMLAAVMNTHRRIPVTEPDPEPPGGSRGKRKATTAEKRASARPQLTVTAGGGQKMQQDLPLSKVLPAHDPFDEKNAPANEREWYERVKSAPKAKQ